MKLKNLDKDKLFSFLSLIGFTITFWGLCLGFFFGSPKTWASLIFIAVAIFGGIFLIWLGVYYERKAIEKMQEAEIKTLLEKKEKDKTNH
jgi:threonine/homoserine/homoserine lactone efflux protein